MCALRRATAIRPGRVRSISSPDAGETGCAKLVPAMRGSEYCDGAKSKAYVCCQSFTLRSHKKRSCKRGGHGAGVQSCIHYRGGDARLSRARRARVGLLYGLFLRSAPPRACDRGLRADGCRAIQRRKSQSRRARGPWQPLGARGLRRDRNFARLSAGLHGSEGFLDPRRRYHSLAWRRSLRRRRGAADLAGVRASPPLQRARRHPTRAYAGHARGLWRHSSPQLSGPHHQLAGMGAGLSFHGRRAADGADDSAAHRAHPRGRAATARAFRRAVRRLPQPHVTPDSGDLLERGREPLKVPAKAVVTMRRASIIGRGRAGSGIAAAIVFAAMAQAAAPQRPVPPGVVYLRDVDPSIVQDIRYAGSDNFVRRPLPGYEAAECILRRDVAVALKRAQADLAASGLSLKVYDCYRPTRAVRAMAALVNDGRSEAATKRFFPKLPKSSLLRAGYVAWQSGDSAGTAIYLTLMSAVKGSARTLDPAPVYETCTGPLRRPSPVDV